MKNSKIPMESLVKHIAILLPEKSEAEHNDITIAILGSRDNLEGAIKATKTKAKTKKRKLLSIK